MYVAFIAVAVVAPVLSNPTAVSTGQTTATGAVDTDTGSGTLYRYASINATETSATIKASGTTSTIVASGSQSGLTFTGLTAATTYYAHFVQVALALDSNVVHSASFITDSAAVSAYLDFEGPSVGALTTYYDSGAEDYNVIFSDQSAVKSGGGTDGAQVLYQDGSGQITLTKSDNFTSPVDFDYASSGSVTITIRDSGGGTITVLGLGDTDGDWAHASLEFSGSARSIEFAGAANAYVIDAMTLTAL